jgi:hypothetical protein
LRDYNARSPNVKYLKNKTSGTSRRYLIHHKTVYLLGLNACEPGKKRWQPHKFKAVERGPAEIHAKPKGRIIHNILPKSTIFRIFLAKKRPFYSKKPAQQRLHNAI